MARLAAMCTVPWTRLTMLSGGFFRGEEPRNPLNRGRARGTCNRRPKRDRSETEAWLIVRGTWAGTWAEFSGGRLSLPTRGVSQLRAGCRAVGWLACGPRWLARVIESLASSASASGDDQAECTTQPSGWHVGEERGVFGQEVAGGWADDAMAT